MKARSSCIRATAALLLGIAVMSCSEKPPILKPPYIEWFMFDADGYAMPVNMVFSLESIPLLDVTKPDRLEDAVAQRWGTVHGRRELKVIHGIPCIISDSGDYPSNMDILVDLDVKDATAWESMVEVLRQVRCNLVFGDGLNTSSMAKPRKFPPPAFWEQRAINLTMQQVTAREALCAILARAPVQTGLLIYGSRSRRWPDDKTGETNVRLYFFKDGREYVGPADGSPPEGKDPKPFFDGIRAIELSPEECEELGLVREDAGDEDAE